MPIAIHHPTGMPPPVELLWTLRFPNHEADHRNDSSRFTSNTTPRHSTETGSLDADGIADNFALLLRSRLARVR